MAEKKKAMTKSEMFAAIAEQTDLSKKQVASVIDTLTEMAKKTLGKKGGPGEFTLPGLAKIKVVRKPATPKRRGVDPFTKLEREFPAKPARNVVRIRPLKGLKDAV